MGYNSGFDSDYDSDLEELLFAEMFGGGGSVVREDNLAADEGLEWFGVDPMERNPMQLYKKSLPDNKMIYGVLDGPTERAHLEVFKAPICWDDYEGEYRDVFYVANLLFPESKLEWDARLKALHALEDDLRAKGITELYTMNYDGPCDNAGHIYGFELCGVQPTLYGENYAYRKILK